MSYEDEIKALLPQRTKSHIDLQYQSAILALARLLDQFHAEPTPVQAEIVACPWVEPVELQRPCILIASHPGSHVVTLPKQGDPARQYVAPIGVHAHHAKPSYAPVKPLSAPNPISSYDWHGGDNSHQHPVRHWCETPDREGYYMTETHSHGRE